LAQTNLGFNKQVADLEEKVKHLTEQLAIANKPKEEPSKEIDADKHLVEESNLTLMVNSKDKMIEVLETENRQLKMEIQR
jgi:hypothetical protein